MVDNFSSYLCIYQKWLFSEILYFQNRNSVDTLVKLITNHKSDDIVLTVVTRYPPHNSLRKIVRFN